MNPVLLAFVIIRRMFFYTLFVIFGIAFLIYVANGFLQFSEHLKAQRQALEKIDADVISPKGSSVEHLRRILKLEMTKAPALIPSQLYTTLNSDKPQGLELTPVLIWGSYKDVPVIAADQKLQKILVSDFHEISSLSKSEVIVGKDVAARLHLKAGDQIEIETQFGDMVSENKKIPFTVNAISQLAAWNGAILSPLEQIGVVTDQVHFLPKQIWDKLILSYIFVTGPQEYLDKTRHLIDTRTVAVDLNLKEEVPSLLRLSGMNERLEAEVLIFALLSSLISTIAFLTIWLPILRRISFKLRRSGYLSSDLAKCFGILGVLILMISSALAASAAYFYPLL